MILKSKYWSTSQAKILNYFRLAVSIVTDRHTRILQHFHFLVGAAPSFIGPVVDYTFSRDKMPFPIPL